MGGGVNVCGVWVEQVLKYIFLSSQILYLTGHREFSTFDKKKSKKYSMNYFFIHFHITLNFKNFKYYKLLK